METQSGAHRPAHAKPTPIKEKPKYKGLKFAAISVLALLLIVIVGLFVAVNILRSQGKEAMNVEYNEGQIVNYQGIDYCYNQDVISVCLLGCDDDSADDEPNKADVVAVLALDTQTGKTTCIVIPRESMVEVNNYVGGAFTGTKTEQICLAFTYGDGKEASAENVVASVQRVLTNVPINYYVALYQEGVRPLNDAIGGVTLTALDTIRETSIVEGQEVTLLGREAEYYILIRDMYGVEGSQGRMQRQMQYARAFANKVLDRAISEGDIGVLTDLFSLLQEYSVTNLGVSEFSYLASVLLEKGITDLQMVSLSGTMTQGSRFAEFALDEENVRQVVLDTFYTPVEVANDSYRAQP